jgi:hypothetical protein
VDAAEAITVAARPHTRCSPSPADGRAQIGIGGHDPAPAVNDNVEPPTATVWPCVCHNAFRAWSIRELH